MCQTWCMIVKLQKFLTYQISVCEIIKIMSPVPSASVKPMCLCVHDIKYMKIYFLIVLIFVWSYGGWCKLRSTLVSCCCFKCAMLVGQTFTYHLMILNFSNFRLVSSPPRRLGVELGKVQVYQEANRGEAMTNRKYLLHNFTIRPAVLVLKIYEYVLTNCSKRYVWENDLWVFCRCCFLRSSQQPVENAHIFKRLKNTYCGFLVIISFILSHYNHKLQCDKYKVVLMM